MALSKTQRVDRIEIERDGTVTVRRMFTLFEDSVEIAQIQASGKRYSPTDDISSEPLKIRTLIIAARDATS